MIEGGYSYPSIYSPVISWVRRMARSGYTLSEILSQIKILCKLTDLDRWECEMYVRECFLHDYYYDKKIETWCDGWTQDKWDQYHRHMKLQELGV